MRRPNIIEAIKKGLASLPLDIEVWLYGSEARGDARPGDYDDMFDNTLETVNELYPKAQEFIAAVKEKVDIWLAENKV